MGSSQLVTHHNSVLSAAHVGDLSHLTEETLVKFKLMGQQLANSQLVFWNMSQTDAYKKEYISYIYLDDRWCRWCTQIIPFRIAAQCLCLSVGLSISHMTFSWLLRCSRTFKVSCRTASSEGRTSVRDRTFSFQSAIFPKPCDTWAWKKVSHMPGFSLTSYNRSTFVSSKTIINVTYIYLYTLTKEQAFHTLVFLFVK